MMKKQISLTIIAILLLSAFAGLAIQTAKAYSIIDLYCSESQGFEHDETIVLWATYHLSTWGFPVWLEARLLRSVSWIVDNVFTYSSNEVVGVQQQWIKTEEYGPFWGIIDEDFACYFEDTLDLEGLRWDYPNHPEQWDNTPPNQWTNVHWIVGYKIEYKIGETLMATTGDLSPGYPNYVYDTNRIGHDELSIYTTDVYDYGTLAGSADIYNPDGIVGAADNDAAALYGYYQGDAEFIQATCRQPTNPDWNPVIPPNRYNLWINTYTWEGQQADIAIYADDNGPQGWYANGDWYYPGGMQYIVDMAISFTASEWINCGEVPTRTQNIVIVMMSSYGSGIVWLDAVELVPIGQEPTA